MLEKILDIKKREKFDFREYTYPHDELSNLFEEWVEYYQWKYAICKSINPRSILEIGVRYGYSAITFLRASEGATYLDIDNNSESYGGAIGAIEWAKKITENYETIFLIADTQAMTTLPGKFYDFIHIDGQQDGDGTYHDLELSLKKGKWILVDGYFWTKENTLSSTHFLEKYKKFIDYSIIINDYAGELLIKTKYGMYKEGQDTNNFKTYDILKNHYDKYYFFRDCGGYESFKRTEGQQLDRRLLSICIITNPKRNEKILDIGCGRGELSHALSKNGTYVTGIDYSKDAIDIAKKTFCSDSNKYLNFICADFLECTFKTKFDRIIAADFVEHIEKTSLELALQKISSLLTKKGFFIVHTSPNKLNYIYQYKKLRNSIRQAGVYIPKNPRTYYEDLMHINEQTPAALNRTLNKYFKCVVTWLPVPDIAGSLLRPLKKSEISNSKSIFSVASNKEYLKNKILQIITQNKIDPKKLNVDIILYQSDIKFTKSIKTQIKITLLNKSNINLASYPPYPIHLSYHWMSENNQVIVAEGLRTEIYPALLPDEKREFYLNIITPEKQGRFLLHITLVQEEHSWFNHVFKNVLVKVD